MGTSDSWAHYWAVDLHVHTPASEDADDDDFGEPADVVRAAVAAGLDCIAITDHNRADWCDRMATVAKDHALVVLPGVELSTRDGHLLGIWEEGTPGSAIEDVLIGLGIRRDQLGGLDIVAARDMAECATAIADAGGIAIAAHIEKERGILRQPVQTHVNALLGHPAIDALEYVHAETVATVRNKIGAGTMPAMVQGSDCWDAQLSRHSLSGIGARRTWIKASRPDVVGIRHALDDPQLRVRVTNPNDDEPHPTVTSVRFSAGFLHSISFAFSPDLNCLLGGTGSGKSLVLEAIRFVLDQQVDRCLFENVCSEVESRLKFALGEGSSVTVEVTDTSERYRFTRTWALDAPPPECQQWVDTEWVDIQESPSRLLPIAAFSQGEILEHARQPVGRVGLIDAHLDLAEVDGQVEGAELALSRNADRLLSARQAVNELIAEAAKVPQLREQVRKLADVFDTDTVKRQGEWTKEKSSLDGVTNTLALYSRPTVSLPEDVSPLLTPKHKEVFGKVNDALASLRAESAAALQQLDDSFAEAQAAIAAARASWDTSFTDFKKKLDDELQEASGTTSLPALRRQLERLQGELDRAEGAAKKLEDEARPELDASAEQREEMLASLRDARSRRRELRRERVRALNRKTSGFVKLDIPASGDTSDFRAALDALKVGSRVREPVLDAIAKRINPFHFVRALWQGNVNDLVDEDNGIAAADIARLLANIDERDLWRELLDAQIIDVPDVLDIKFRKPDHGTRVRIEELSHGEKCTAILVILLADGTSPVLIDQPEDALHAPWIEEYLVDRLRELRGSRQYIFATRSPGMVISADAEQIITLKASAGRGECEAQGSLERHDLNELALHHLEGGRVPFRRRTRKLRPSLAANS